jgi:hypothetical protein
VNRPLRALRATAALPPADRALLARSAIWLARCRVALWTRSFTQVRRAADAWGQSRHETGVAPGRLAWAIETAARAVPGATCLTQALAAEVLLRRAGEHPEMRFGVALGSGDFEAHAWLELDGRVVVGRAGVERFTPLGSGVVVPGGPPVDSVEP